MVLAAVVEGIAGIAVWGFVASLLLTLILHGSQGLGWSRLSLSFLVGTWFTGNRHRAQMVGFAVYLIGGWLFAALYFMVFYGLGHASWWSGLLIGLLHGAFVLVVVLPVIPYGHPRMATEYDGPVATRRLEPPGFLGLNYGHQTPLIALLGHGAYGWTLGGLLHI